MSQQIDTLEIRVINPRMKNFSFGDKKIYLKLEDGFLIKDQIKIHDSIIQLQSNSEHNLIYLKIFYRNGKLYSSGLWNEEGFFSTILFFKKNGKLKSKGHFENGTFVIE